MIQEENKSNNKRVFEKLIIQDNITEVRVLALEWTQELLEDEIMKYKELLDEGIITKEEFSIKEKELLRKIKKYKGNQEGEKPT